MMTEHELQIVALSHAPLSLSAVHRMVLTADLMTRDKLLKVVGKLALSHERLRQELEGAEALIGCPHCGQHCDLIAVKH